MRKYIEKQVTDLINKHKTKDPFEILNQTGVTVEFNHNLTGTKGFFTVIQGKKFVIINGNLPLNEQKEAAAHELGHSILHSHITESEVYRDFMINNMENKPEYEANLFASYLLVSDCEIKNAASLGFSQNQMAAYLGISEKLLKIRTNV